MSENPISPQDIERIKVILDLAAGWSIAQEQCFRDIIPRLLEERAFMDKANEDLADALLRAHDENRELRHTVEDLKAQLQTMKDWKEIAERHCNSTIQLGRRERECVTLYRELDAARKVVEATRCHEIARRTSESSEHLAEVHMELKDALQAYQLLETQTKFYARYMLQWNFGQSQCGFDSIQDVIKFAENDLPQLWYTSTRENAPTEAKSVQESPSSIDATTSPKEKEVESTENHEESK